MRVAERSLSRLTLSTVFLAVLLAAPAGAGTFVITLDDVTATVCDQVWHEAGVPMWFAETTAEDYTSGFCLFVADANNFGKSGIYIWPGRLVLDLSGLEGLQTVEVDVYETHFAGSTRARLYSGASVVDYVPSFQEDEQTLVLTNDGTADLLAISAHEAYVWEIRLNGGDLVGAQQRTFGAVKSLYR